MSNTDSPARSSRVALAPPPDWPGNGVASHGLKGQDAPLLFRDEPRTFLDIGYSDCEGVSAMTNVTLEVLSIMVVSPTSVDGPVTQTGHRLKNYRSGTLRVGSGLPNPSIGQRPSAVGWLFGCR